MYAQNRNVTYIDDLPELEDLESRDGMNRGMQNISNQFSEQGDHYGSIPEKFRKFIRAPMGIPPDQSGMSPYQHRQPEEFFPPPPPQHPLKQQMYNTEEHYKQLHDTPSCLDVHSHISQCPICSRFFKNDNAVYIIAIVVLSIICILLLKRVLNL